MTWDNGPGRAGTVVYCGLTAASSSVRVVLVPAPFEAFFLSFLDFSVAAAQLVVRGPRGTKRTRPPVSYVAEQANVRRVASVP